MFHFEKLVRENQLDFKKPCLHNNTINLLTFMPKSYLNNFSDIYPTKCVIIHKVMGNYNNNNT